LQAVIDLLIPGRTPGIKEDIVDLYNKPELLFFGPDGMFMRMTACPQLHIYLVIAEGTADMMDWAARAYSALASFPVSWILRVTCHSTRS